MKKLKVVHILHSVGGVDVSLRLIVENINSENVESIIIHGIGDTKKPFKNNQGKQVKEYMLPIQREISPLKDLIAIWKTSRLLRKEKPDVVHAHSAKGGIIARAASIFYKTKVLHTPQAYSYLSEPKGFKRTLFLGIEKFFKRINSVLLASSNSERNRGVKEVKYAPEKALLWNNCIVPIEEMDFQEPEISLPENYICTVGRPSFQKNIEMMIEVLHELKKQEPEIHLVLMGVGEYSPNKQNVERMIEEFGLEEQVTMIPWIERNKIFSIVKRAQLYISTARYEGLPYSIIEALSLGKACVVTDCDGNRDLIVDGINGYVIADNSVEMMANRIFALLKDDDLRNKFEQNAQKRFEEHFNIRKNIHALEEIYFKLSKR
ncbi:MAG: glycosyltransferase [Flavobacteriaceae bacterium]|nr:glycosyltransferase [Flavobacteriaceae bacterium]